MASSYGSGEAGFAREYLEMVNKDIGYSDGNDLVIESMTDILIGEESSRRL